MVDSALAFLLLYSVKSESVSAIHWRKVSSGGRTIKLRTRSSSKVKDWVTAINAARQPPEGWCYPHRFGSFAPPRGLLEDGSMAQWFIDGQAGFEAIASSIEHAKSEVCFLVFLQLFAGNYLSSYVSLKMFKIFFQIFITGWWLCPELYLRRPFEHHGSSRLDALLEARAKQGVQVFIFQPVNAKNLLDGLVKCVIFELSSSPLVDVYHALLANMLLHKLS
jgi:phosphatidylserine/phosphatidylglycerophosphate/cardiolipin synthase-like enzyme